jgi:hypothetical protein
MKKALNFIESMEFWLSIIVGVPLCWINAIVCVLVLFGTAWNILFGYFFVLMVIFILVLLCLRTTEKIIEKMIRKQGN